MSRFVPPVAFRWIALLPPFALSAREPVWDARGFTQEVQPFLETHCVRCHGPEKEEGEFRLDTHLPRDFTALLAREKWGEVVNVLNGHEMPPKKEQQPRPEETARVVDWITAGLVEGEQVRRDNAVVLRRLNRTEYRNTLRELLGVEPDVSALPLDPAAGGFDNNGQALSLSPLHIELYHDIAAQSLDRALVTGPRPETIRWRFEPEQGDGDSHRIDLPPRQRPIVHGGKNRKQDGFTVMQRDNWDRVPNVRDFRVPVAGEYRIRVRAGGKVPSREEVVDAARGLLDRRRQEQDAKQPARARQNQEQMERDLAHFRTDRMYDYGPPRLTVVHDLSGQPVPVRSFDVEARHPAPGEYECRARFNTDKTGIRIQYAYSIPKVLENFWLQGKDEFPRPEAWLDWIELEGPLYDAWPPSSHHQVLGEPPEGLDETARARAVLQRFLRRAYRRPVRPEEVEAKVALFTRARAEKPDFLSAIKTPLIAALCSPHFLYLVEPSPAEARARPLTGPELASRLSYFLWSGPPDEALLRRAESGGLNDPAVLRREAGRLLADPRLRAFVENFAGQWLGLRAVGANPPAPDLFPRYDRHLEVSMVEESLAFFEDILHAPRSVLEFIRSDHVVINERLARFYGIPGVRGDHFRRVPVPPGVARGGLPTQASILTVTSNGTRTSPVVRGTWVLKTLFGQDPGLPVANVGEIAPQVPGIDKATVRQRLQIHRELPQCARCHDRIDPLGFALENYNAAGEWRLQEGFGYKGRIERNDPLIDASGALPDGTPFTGVSGLQDVLLAREDLFLEALCERLLTYALGRQMGVADRPAVREAARHLKANGHRLPALIEHIVSSPAFRST
jgi:mono/diheme cytochrome c family protein